MDEPFLPPRQSSMQSMQPRHGQPNQSSHIVQLPPEFLMPVPFCKLIYKNICWACSMCLCCVI